MPNLNFIAVLVLISFGSLAEAAPTRKNTTHKTQVSKAGHKKTSTTAVRGRRGSPQALARARKPVRVTQQAPSQDRYTEIQQALAAKGYYSGPVNGSWGSDSVDALKRFQQDQNLSPDGKLGALSLIALGLGPKRDPGSALAGKPQPPSQ